MSMDYATRTPISEEQKARERAAYLEWEARQPHRDEHDGHRKKPLSWLEAWCSGYSDPPGTCLEKKLASMLRSRDGFTRTAAQDYQKAMRETR